MKYFDYRSYLGVQHLGSKLDNHCLSNFCRYSRLLVFLVENEVKMVALMIQSQQVSRPTVTLEINWKDLNR